MVWQEVGDGKTVAITSGGETIARILPVPASQADAAVLAP